MSEYHLAVQVADLLRALGLDFVHVPNEGKRSPVRGAQQRRMGVQSGFPDLLIFDAPPAMPDKRGAAIELKVHPGLRRDGAMKASPGLTEAQHGWLVTLERHGWATAVCFGLDEVRDTLARMGWRTR